MFWVLVSIGSTPIYSSYVLYNDTVSSCTPVTLEIPVKENKPRELKRTHVLRCIDVTTEKLTSSKFLVFSVSDRLEKLEKKERS